MKGVLSDVQLSREFDALIAELESRCDPSELDSCMRREPFPKRVFPVDGYRCWQERWAAGTGRVPPSWRVHH